MNRLYFIVICLFSVSVSVSATNIYKCKDSDGKITFSGKPCLNDKNEQKILFEDSGSNVIKNDKQKYDVDSSKSIMGYSGDELKKYLENLEIESFSKVLAGIEKNSFHGILIEKLFMENNVSIERWYKTDESLEYMVHLNEDYQMFVVKKSVFNEDQNSHAFLDLSDEKVLLVLSSKGFEAPNDLFKEADYIWTWTIGDIECELQYHRNRFNPEKGFSYSCKKN